MSKNIRIITRLDVKGSNVVKGVHFEGLRVIGRPELFARQYYEDGADEIIYIDTVASLYGRNNLEEIVLRAADCMFIPLTVGGGIRNIDDMQRLLRAGADKIVVNTAAIKNPQLIKDGAKVFGSQCIVVSVQAKRKGSGRYECMVDNARELTGVDVFEWVKEVADLGAGEILLTSVDRDGTGKGFDLELVSGVSGLVDIPVIAGGGAGKLEDVKEVVINGRADAVCCASLFHYALLDVTDDAAYEEEGNIEFLKNRLPLSARERKGIKATSILKLKQYLAGNGINCRYPKLANSY